MICHNCGSNQIIYQTELSSSICLECGIVIENYEQIINENPYSENKKIGNNFNLLISNHIINSDNKIKKLFQKLISTLNLPEYFLQNSIKYYKLASNKNFTKGRSQILICCIILYTLCRLNNTQHLLIDFSDISKINIYKLGYHYLKFIKLFNIKINLIEPSLFLKRFINKLNLEIKIQKNILNNSLRIIQCMKKDWLIEGRNPCGICGAAIYISLSINNIKFDLNSISDIVKISKETIKKRINEFSNSRFCKFTKEEFLNLNFNNINEGNPPSFIKNRLNELNNINDNFNNENLLNEQILKSENFFDNDNNALTKCESSKSSKYFNDNLNNNSMNDEKNLFLDAQIFLGKKHYEEKKFDLNNYNLNYNCNNNTSYNDEILSELNNSDNSEYIIKDDNEYKIKKAIWEEKNKEWIIEQKEKNKINMKHKVKDKIKEKEKEKNKKNMKLNFENPKDAILHNDKLLKIRMKNKASFIDEILHKKIFI